MCSIFGFVRNYQATVRDIHEVTDELRHVSHASRERGKDAWGIGWIFGTDVEISKSLREGRIPDLINVSALVGNCRAEPTTEWVEKKTADHAHPFASNRYIVVHNGVVSNDKELEIATKTGIDSEVIPHILDKFGFPDGFFKLKGSFASLILDRKTGLFHGFRDYKPLVAKRFNGGIIFASKAEYFKTGSKDAIFIPPYCYFTVNRATLELEISPIPRETPDSGRAFVVCSGGLDSTTVAKAACDTHGAQNVTLLHFMYGCQAQHQEKVAVLNIAHALGCQFRYIDLDFIKQLGGNALTDASIEIKDSIAGAEYAHEWVPFRNGVMISLAAALCDRFDVRHIYLGLNLEEGGAFPDNTEEFYQKFNEVLQLGSMARPVIHNPLGSMMKHEIVKLALEIDAPIHLSWSCYRDGKEHCGRCAPCFMRRTAFKMNGREDMITYES